MNKITVTIEVPSEEQEHVAQMLSSSINRIIFNHPNVKVQSQALFVALVGEGKRTTVGRGQLKLRATNRDKESRLAASGSGPNPS